MDTLESIFVDIMGDLRSQDELIRDQCRALFMTGDSAYDLAFDKLLDTGSNDLTNILDRVLDDYKDVIHQYLFDSLYANHDEVTDDQYHRDILHSIRNDIQNVAGGSTHFVNVSDFTQFMDTHADVLQYDNIYTLMRDDLCKMVAYSIYTESPMSSDISMHGNVEYSESLKNIWQLLYAKADDTLGYQMIDESISDAEDAGMRGLDMDF